MENRSTLRWLSAVLRHCTFIGALLAIAASSCGPIPTPPPIPTDTLEPTPRPTLATPTPTATWTVAPTRTLPPELPTRFPTSTAKPTTTRAPMHTPTPTAMTGRAATVTSTPPPTVPLTATTAQDGTPTPPLILTAPPAGESTPVTGHPAWRGEYYANPDLHGNPALVRDDAAIGFDWGTEAPAPGLPADAFSVRWTRDKEFDPGRYHLFFQADDGFRFWVDDELLLDEWHSAREDTYQVEVDLPWKPRLKVEFYEDSGDAKMKLWWERI